MQPSDQTPRHPARRRAPTSSSDCPFSLHGKEGCVLAAQGSLETEEALLGRVLIPSGRTQTPKKGHNSHGADAAALVTAHGEARRVPQFCLALGHVYAATQHT